MTRIKKGGRELVVADGEVNGYLQEGYVVIDYRKKQPETADELKLENARLKQTITQQGNKIDAMNRDIETLKRQLAANNHKERPT